MEIALKVAGGGESVLGLDVETHGPVGYWWQDDSKEAELERLKAYAGQHGYTGDVPIRWHLNENLRFPDNVDSLRAEIRARGPGLRRTRQPLQLPSASHQAQGRGGRAGPRPRQEQGRDPTGCAVAFVDHSPWPSDANRGQLRGSGGVFKAAAIRWGVYLERKKGSGEVWIEARGNNVAGFRRKLFLWDEDALEFCPVDRQQIAQDDLEKRIYDTSRDTRAPRRPRLRMASQASATESAKRCGDCSGPPRARADSSCFQGSLLGPGRSRAGRAR